MNGRCFVKIQARDRAYALAAVDCTKKHSSGLAYYLTLYVFGLIAPAVFGRRTQKRPQAFEGTRRRPG